MESFVGSFFKEEKVEDKDRISLFKLQCSIVDKLNKHNYAMVFDEPGSGKTITAIHSILDIMSKKKKDETTDILIVAPNEQLALKWREEIFKFTGAQFSIIENKSECYDGYKEGRDNLVITFNGSNYENLGINKLVRNEIIIVDFKNFTYEELIKFENVKIKIDSDMASEYYTEKCNNLEEILKEMMELKINISREDLIDILRKYQYLKENSKQKDITKYRVSCYKPIEWDLMIIDEAHAIYKNYYNQLIGKKAIVGNGELYYEKVTQHKSSKLLIMTATPKYIDELNGIVKKILIDNSKVQGNLEITNFFEVSDNIPYQKYFKEMIIDNTYSRKRNVEIIEYEVSDLMQKINKKNYKDRNFYRYQEHIKFMIDKLDKCDFSKEEVEKIECVEGWYNTENEVENYKLLKGLDNKLYEFIKYIKSIEYIKSIIFVRHIETKVFLIGILKRLGIKVFPLECDINSEERLKVIERFNKYNGKKVLITTWRLGNFGLNIQGADSVICYETPCGIDELEQGFGRIDRLDLGFEVIKLILFKNTNGYGFDKIGISRLFSKLFKYQSIVPTKNILFTSEYLKEYLKDVECRFKELQKVDEIIKGLKGQEKLVQPKVEKVKFIEKLNEINIDYEKYYFDLGLYNEDVDLREVEENILDSKKTKDDIQILKDKLSLKYDNVDIIELFKSVIYYRDGENLKFISEDDLKIKMNEYKSEHFEKVQESQKNIKLFTKEEIEIYLSENYSSKYREMVLKKIK